VQHCEIPLSALATHGHPCRTAESAILTIAAFWFWASSRVVPGGTSGGGLAPPSSPRPALELGSVNVARLLAGELRRVGEVAKVAATNRAEVCHGSGRGGTHRAPAHRPRSAGRREL